MAYDTDNVFAKIIRGELPADKVYEDDHVIAIKDINPQAPVHLLIIPKGQYISMTDFSLHASPAEVTALFQTVGMLAQEYGLDSTGYRMITNTGENGGQEVDHLHIHLLGGRKLGRMLPDKT